MKHGKYQQELGVTVACTKRMKEAANDIGQKYSKGATKECFIFDSWVSSKKATEDVMEFGAEFICMGKTNNKGFCKDTIDKLTKYWYGVSYIVLISKPMVPRGRPLIDIGYKYNVKNVIYLIITYNAGSTQDVIPYLSKYPNQFTNAFIRPVARLV